MTDTEMQELAAVAKNPAAALATLKAGGRAGMKMAEWLRADLVAAAAKSPARVNTEDGASFRADGSVFRVIGRNGISGGNRDLD